MRRARALPTPHAAGAEVSAGDLAAALRAVPWKCAWEECEHLDRAKTCYLLPDYEALAAVARDHLSVSPFDKIGADRLADEVAVLVKRGVIDSRSPAADALLDYRNPPSSPRADRLAELETTRATARRDVNAVARKVVDETDAVIEASILGHKYLRYDKVYDFIVEGIAVAIQAERQRADGNFASYERVKEKYSQVTHALAESVKLQSHYAGLLNQYDGGQRIEFKDAEEWLARLAMTPEQRRADVEQRRGAEADPSSVCTRAAGHEPPCNGLPRAERWGACYEEQTEDAWVRRKTGA